MELIFKETVGDKIVEVYKDFYSKIVHMPKHRLNNDTIGGELDYKRDIRHYIVKANTGTKDKVLTHESDILRAVVASLGLYNVRKNQSLINEWYNKLSTHFVGDERYIKFRCSVENSGFKYSDNISRIVRLK